MWGEREMYAGSWRGKLKEKDHLKDPGVDGKIVLQFI
jgi:hypothetical protein